MHSPYVQNVENYPRYDIISAYTRDKGVPQFHFRNISHLEVMEVKGLLDQLPTGKLPGYDSISGHCVKSVKQYIGAPLTTLVSRMFTEHLFPDPLKKADVTPINKKDNILIKRNYGPVSVLITFSKIFEMPCLTEWTPI